MPWTRDEIAARAARGLRDGYHVNLGIGIPALVANHIPPGIEVTLQSGNGMLGMGPFPFEGEADPDLIIIDLTVPACDERAGGLCLAEPAPGVTLAEVRARTGAHFAVALA